MQIRPFILAHEVVFKNVTAKVHFELFQVDSAQICGYTRAAGRKGGLPRKWPRHPERWPPVDRGKDVGKKDGVDA